MNGTVRPLLLSEPAIDALGFLVLRFDVATEVSAVDLDGAGKLGLVWIVNLRAHRLAQLVR
jgi:hypothetical protein